MNGLKEIESFMRERSVVSKEFYNYIQNEGFLYNLGWTRFNSESFGISAYHIAIHSVAVRLFIFVTKNYTLSV